MWIFYTALSLLVLLTIYFFILPLSKKRPVLIRYRGLFVYLVVLTGLFHQSRILPVVAILVGVAIFFMLLFRPWFMYGLTRAMMENSLVKAASVTRTPLEKTDGNYILDNRLRVYMGCIWGRIGIILFKQESESKKAKLTTVVFKKFIQNYFV